MCVSKSERMSVYVCVREGESGLSVCVHVCQLEKENECVCMRVKDRRRVRSVCVSVHACQYG